MKINSHNEWDTLKEVILGRAEGPASLRFLSNKIPTENVLNKAKDLSAQAYPKWLSDEVSEDLEGLNKIFEDFNVKVHRPNLDSVGVEFQTPFIAGAAEHIYNMRDLHLVVGDMVIESPSQEQHRFFEPIGLYDIFYEYMKENGFRWVSSPKPRFSSEHMTSYMEDGRDQYDDGQKYVKLMEDEILFEAANTVRMGTDLLYLVSRSGNYLGARWLQHILGEEYKVHTTDKIYKSSHIDSTVLCLRPGLVLLNGDRVDTSNCPAIFDEWEKIYFHDIEPIPEATQEFHHKVRLPIYNELLSMGIESNLGSISSKWIGMNFLSLDPNTVIVDDRQINLIKTLEQYGFTVVPTKFRHSYLISGGIHCCTLDTVRESVLESYFAGSGT